MSKENIRRNQEFSKTPELITTPYPFIAIGDLDTIIQRIIPGFDDSLEIQKFQNQLFQIQKKYAPKESTFYYISHKDLVSGIESRVQINSNTRDATGVLNFDRYIFRGSKLSNQMRLELSRGVDNKLVSRPGSTLTKEEQVEALKSWLQSNQYGQVLLVDDVIAFATTFPPIVELIRGILPEASIKAIAGICSTQGTWAAKEKLEAIGVTVEAVVTAIASPAPEGSVQGMAIPDSRDSTIFGGKIGKSQNGRSLSYPYFYPFSVPTVSLMREKFRVQASEEWLKFNIELIKYLNSLLGRSMIVADLESKGFGVPFTSVEEFKNKLIMPSSETSVLEYLLYAQAITPGLVVTLEKK